MALTPELQKLKANLETLGVVKRTLAQDRLLAELRAVDIELRKSMTESFSESHATRMTSPGGGACACCGK